MSDEVTPLEMLKTLGAVDSVDAVALVQNRRCLFVEGPSDVSVLGRFASTLGIRALTGDDRVITIPTGGADRFGHVEQLDVFEQLIGTNLASLEIRDRDGRSEEHRQAMVDRASRPLHILERDCIEGYLLSPPVVARAVRDVAEERGRLVEVTEGEIETLLLEICDELREATTDRIAERYVDDCWRLDSERVNVRTANEWARGQVSESWEDLASRLTLVSGKKLLSAIRSRVQSTYGVNFGNERLAEGFRSDEIPEELRTLLESVAALVAN